MQRTLLKSKIHRATVQDANPEYEGSITIDESLMEAADLVEYEKVMVANITNGNRFETYVIRGPRDSGTICVNGAAAHLVGLSDLVTVFSYVQLEKKEVEAHRPILVHVDASNRIADLRRTPEPEPTPIA